MHIFSSMTADNILVGENTKRGVQAMRGFLHFAERGNIEGLGTLTGKAPDSDFEVAVIEALQAEGFECEPQVGVAGFYIDLAVKDPGNPGRYLMGVECDGATYHSAKSARDRDRLRQEVLERLGWRIRRIWSTDWFSNPRAELQPIIRELHSLKSEPRIAVEENEELSFEFMAEEVDAEEQSVIGYINTEETLKERLTRFNREVVETQLPDTLADRRLLRSSMIEALVEHEPVSKSEFSEMVPQYLRQGTENQEAQLFLDKVLDIIAGVEEEAARI